MFTNAGDSLIEIARADGEVGSFDFSFSLPWISGPNVAFVASELTTPSRAVRRIFVFDSTNNSLGFFSVADARCPTCIPTADNPSMAGNAVTSRRVTTGLTSLVIADSTGGIDELVIINSTLIPGQPGRVFVNISQFPVLDSDGADIAFWGTGGGRFEGWLPF